jgi:hypothetical protein
MIKKKTNFIKNVPEDNDHDCNMPSLDDIDTAKTNVGSIWLCPECGEKWKIRFIEYGGQMGEGRWRGSGIDWENLRGGFGNYIENLFDAILGL